MGALGIAASAYYGQKSGELSGRMGRTIKKTDSVFIFNFLIVLHCVMAVFLFLGAVLFTIDIFDSDLATRVDMFIFGL